MNRYRVAISSVSLVAFTIFVFFVFTNRENIHVNNDNILSKQRDIVYNLEEERDISSTITGNVLQPVNVKVDEESIYVVDWGAFEIKRFDKQAELVNTIGKGKGRGPGEFVILGAFDVHRDTLWTLDPRQNRVSVFDTRGNHLDQFSVEGNVLQIVVTDENLAIFGLTGDLFYMYDRQGNLITNFGTLIDDQYENPLAVDGALEEDARDENGSTFLFQPAYASYLYPLSDTSIQDTMRTLDEREYPAARRKSATRISAPTPPVRYADVGVSNGHVYVMAVADSVSGDKRRGIKHAYLDVYRRDPFTYEGSARVPAPTGTMEVMNDTLYTITDTSFVAYRIERR